MMAPPTTLRVVTPQMRVAVAASGAGCGADAGCVRVGCRCGRWKHWTKATKPSAATSALCPKRRRRCGGKSVPSASGGRAQAQGRANLLIEEIGPTVTRRRRYLQPRPCHLLQGSRRRRWFGDRRETGCPPKPLRSSPLAPHSRRDFLRRLQPPSCRRQRPLTSKACFRRRACVGAASARPLRYQSVAPGRRQQGSGLNARPSRESQGFAS
mmetsp:Transcript_42315/g.116715  ORF Transcript_42315/g.116715 Transcript_42315/m.116715 type:complete len:211 (+) Transcript_42315:431-1063(+)